MLKAAVFTAGLLLTGPSEAHRLSDVLGTSVLTSDGWNGTLHCQAAGALAIAISNIAPISIPGLGSTWNGALVCSLNATFDLTIGDGIPSVGYRRIYIRHIRRTQ